LARSRGKSEVVEHLGCQLRIDRKSASDSYPALYAQKIKIESELGSGKEAIKWGPPEREGRPAKIEQYGKNTDLNSRNDWPEYFAWLKERAESFQRVLVPRLKALRSEMQEDEEDEGKE